ncbi:MAG: hypothetical protein ACXIUV_04340 [Alkalilacustris sp.]
MARRPDPGPFVPHLQEGERLLWRGRPAGDFRFRIGSRRGLGREELLCLLVGLGFVFAGITVFWRLAPLVAHGGAALGEALFALTIAAAGVALIVGPHWADMRRRQRQHYALTDRRALVLTGTRLLAHPLTADSPAELIPGTPGGVVVTIRRRPLSTTALLLGRRIRPGDVLSFELIEDAERVRSLVEQHRGRAA